MGKLNLAAIKGRVATPPKVQAENSETDSQLSISQAIQTPRTEKKPELRADGSEVKRAKEAQIIIRTSAKMRRELKRWAVDEDVTVQSLIVAGLQALRRERGLPDLPE